MSDWSIQEEMCGGYKLWDATFATPHSIIFTFTSSTLKTGMIEIPTFNFLLLQFLKEIVKIWIFPF